MSQLKFMKLAGTSVRKDDHNCTQIIDYGEYSFHDITFCMMLVHKTRRKIQRTKHLNISLLCYTVLCFPVVDTTKTFYRGHYNMYDIEYQLRFYR